MTQVLNDSGRAVLLLGHGSKRKEANDTLREVAATVEAAGGYAAVVPAFLQLAEPNIEDAIDSLVGRGFMEIVVMPYFLYTGLHVKEDIPAELEAARARHPGLTVTLTKSLGFHNKLIDITLERIEEAAREGTGGGDAFTQHPIEKESFRILSEELDERGLTELELPVVKRVIHSTADFSFRDIMRFSPGAIEAGIRAIRAGYNVITDVKMVEAGITKKRLSGFGTKVLCFSSDEDVARAAAEGNTTKTAASMRKAAPFLEGSIVAIGNAPTALMELINIVNSGGPRPSLVVGVPVGFVGAAESKEELMGSGLDYIAVKGRRGGSTVAVAIVNAIAILAGEEGWTRPG